VDVFPKKLILKYEYFVHGCMFFAILSIKIELNSAIGMMECWNIWNDGMAPFGQINACGGVNPWLKLEFWRGVPVLAKNQLFL
jgi:hypothetical protein